MKLKEGERHEVKGGPLSERHEVEGGPYSRKGTKPKGLEPEQTQVQEVKATPSEDGARALGLKALYRKCQR